MPKKTFLNLPEKKRHSIEDIAVDEFSTWGFDSASINRIVEKAQIAKGSFYQYFNDKEDLYKHLLTRISEDKIQFISPILLNPDDHDFFTHLIELYRAGLAFAKINRNAALLGNQLLKFKEHPIHVEMYQQSRALAVEFYKPILERVIARGEIKSTVSVDFLVHILMSMNVMILEYYFEVIKQDELNIEYLDDDIMNTVNQFVDFIKNGLGA